MKPKTNATTRWWGLGTLCLALLLGGCALLTIEQFQRLSLTFRLNESIAPNQSVEVHRAFYPAQVKMRRNFIHVHGRLTVPQGADLPARVTARAVAEDLATETVYNRFSMTIPIRSDGSFSELKRFPKNLRARTLQTFSIEVAGSRVPQGARLALCVDVLKRRTDAAAAGSCAGTSGGGGSGGTGQAVVVEVLDNEFRPKSITIQPGQTVRWVLRGQSQNHTSTAMAGTWDSGFVFNAAGAFFERTFSATENGQTFEYFCSTHHSCCAMQGSVRVGAGAPDPPEGY